MCRMLPLMRCTPTFTATLLILLYNHGVAHAGAWAQPDGGGYVEATGHIQRASEVYGADGSIVDIPTLTEYSFAFYGELGITDMLTAMVSFPFFRRLTLNRQVSASSGFLLDNGSSNTWVADADLGVRVQFLSFGAAVLSAELHVGLPIGDSTHDKGLLTGDGRLNVFGALLFGFRFEAVPIYVTASAGYNIRDFNRGFSDELRYDVEGGWEFYDDLSVRLRVSGMISLENGSASVDSDGSPLSGGDKGLYVNNQSLLLLSPSVAWEFIPGLGLAVGADVTIIGRNVLAAPGFWLALFAKI